MKKNNLILNSIFSSMEDFPDAMGANKDFYKKDYGNKHKLGGLRLCI